MPRFSQKSLDILNQSHPDLIRLFKEVIKEYDCSVICGYRGEKEQEEAFRNGYSKAHWKQSPHNFSPSLAVDVIPYPKDWNDIKRFKELAGITKIKAVDMGIEIDWGGDWENFRDYPHYQIHNWLKLI